MAPLSATPARVGGFSLIEVMVAIVVLGIGLVGLTQGITTALESGKESERQTVAALMAAGQMEELRAGGGLIDGELEGDGGPGLELFHWQQTISATDIEGLHKVVVAVQDAGTGQTVFELETLLFERPEDSANNTLEKRTHGRGFE